MGGRGAAPRHSRTVETARSREPWPFEA
jgi:hypothetical protein